MQAGGVTCARCATTCACSMCGPRRAAPSPARGQNHPAPPFLAAAPSHPSPVRGDTRLAHTKRTRTFLIYCPSHLCRLRLCHQVGLLHGARDAAAALPESGRRRRRGALPVLAGLIPGNAAPACRRAAVMSSKALRHTPSIALHWLHAAPLLLACLAPGACTPAFETAPRPSARHAVRHLPPTPCVGPRRTRAHTRPPCASGRPAPLRVLGARECVQRRSALLLAL